MRQDIPRYNKRKRKGKNNLQAGKLKKSVLHSPSQIRTKTWKASLIYYLLKMNKNREKLNMARMSQSQTQKFPSISQFPKTTTQTSWKAYSHPRTK